MRWNFENKLFVESWTVLSRNIIVFIVQGHKDRLKDLSIRHFVKSSKTLEIDVWKKSGNKILQNNKIEQEKEIKKFIDKFYGNRIKTVLPKQ